MKKIKYILIILITFLIDQISKIAIMKNFELGESKILIKDFFKLTYTHNDGAAFGLFGGKTIFIVIVSMCILFYLVYELFKRKHVNLLASISISLIIGGLIGNLLDRIYYGYVRDFLDFKIFNYDFAVFNFGDIAIVVGALLLLVGMILEELHEKNNK